MLNHNIEYKISNYRNKGIFNNVLKSISKNKLSVPFGDFGCMGRCINNNYDGSLYDCIENYIIRYNECSNYDKRQIKEALESYENNLSGRLYQSFPFEEWLYHYRDGNFHSGATFSMCSRRVLTYILRPKDFHEMWIEMLNKNDF